MARQVVASRRFLNKYVNPLKAADLVLVHNAVTKKDLEKYGLKEHQIRVIQLPVPKFDPQKPSDEIKKALKVEKGDVVFATVGFLSNNKGVSHAVKALNLLPENYKLAIIGGIHPEAFNDSFLDDLSDLISKYQLNGRVYITGYVEDDHHLNALIQECDICVFPYARKYYSYVSSAALNNSLANHKPTIAYPTSSFKELNIENQTIVLTKSFNYYEIARELQGADIKNMAANAKMFAEKHSYDKEAKGLIEIYQSLV